MKRLIVAIVLSVIALFIFNMHSNKQHARYLAEKKSEFSGYRLEYFSNEKLLFLYYPNGEKKGVDLSDINTISFYGLNASDSTKNQENSSWLFMGERQMPFDVPYFAVDSQAVLTILKKQFPDIDVEGTLRKSKEFERKKFNFCTIWARPGLKKLEAQRGYSVCAS